MRDCNVTVIRHVGTYMYGIWSTFAERMCAVKDRNHIQCNIITQHLTTLKKVMRMQHKIKHEITSAELRFI